ncbi:hypothetical protein [Aquicella lusitana]|uniref:Uncharacterized protein n=1 Tax=Aquicella lusitana TaxID=254246 RepID=A0A370G795_9COXI|nr:hypothetical protein [Aquicella lusitana]RDI38946.1 hypothetical protein C8D86_1305 [Aquicella lusitana]VVC74305.1 hypothetical protein AQULUS_20700 [Aquicella lusitana]
MRTRSIKLSPSMLSLIILLLLCAYGKAASAATANTIPAEQAQFSKTGQAEMIAKGQVYVPPKSNEDEACA